jgi:hypothetical protein
VHVPKGENCDFGDLVHEDAECVVFAASSSCLSRSPFPAGASPTGCRTAARTGCP